MILLTESHYCVDLLHEGMETGGQPSGEASICACLCMRFMLLVSAC